MQYMAKWKLLQFTFWWLNLKARFCEIFDIAFFSFFFFSFGSLFNSERKKLFKTFWIFCTVSKVKTNEEYKCVLSKMPERCYGWSRKKKSTVHSTEVKVAKTNMYISIDSMFSERIVHELSEQLKFSIQYIALMLFYAYIHETPIQIRTVWRTLKIK